MTSGRETLETVRYTCERCGCSYDSALQARACCLPNHGDDRRIAADGGTPLNIQFKESGAQAIVESALDELADEMGKSVRRSRGPCRQDQISRWEGIVELCRRYQRGDLEDDQDAGDDQEVRADGGSKMQICVLDEDEIDQLKRGGFWLNVDDDGDLILIVPEHRQEEALEAAMDHVAEDADRTVEKPDPGAIPDGGRLLQSPEQGCNCRHLADGAICVECSSHVSPGIPLAGGV